MTTTEETLTKLHELKLTSMAKAVRELMDTAPGQQLSFDEKLGIIVDREWTDRDNRRLSRRIKEAKLLNPGFPRENVQNRCGKDLRGFCIS